MTALAAAVARPGRLLALAAIGVALEAIALVAAARHAFGDGHPLLHAQHRPGAHAILWLGGLWVAGSGLAATYLALRRSRAWAAALWLALGFPLVVVGVASLYASLLLASWL